MGTPNAQQPVKSWRNARLLPVTGVNPREFLQGYLTSNTDRINQATCTPMALCNLKGRVVTSGFAVEINVGADAGNTIGLIIHESLVETVATLLRPYAMFSRCQVASEQALFLQLSDTEDGFTLGDFRLISSAEDTPSEDASDLIEAHLIDQGFAFLSQPVAEKFLPQMLGLDDAGAVDFDKGCYLGQEIVARAQFRGEVKRHLERFTWKDEVPALGEPWQEIECVIAVSRNHSGLGVRR